MKLVSTIIAILFFISLSYGQHDDQFIKKHLGIHKVIVNEVLQTSSYTYLLVQDGDKMHWLAVPRIEAEIGEIYYYQGGNEMKDFKSSQLNRTFESVLFLGGIVNADPLSEDNTASPTSSKNTSKKTTRIEVGIRQIDDGITIAELFLNKLSYAEKTVKIKGKVTQFSASIMDRNWIHLQDGTNYKGNFDLVATSDMVCKEGEIVIIEGKITLDKDFGFGYFYKVIMEESRLIQ